ncbi:MAG: hypothetical protein IT581_07250 [Verrucomicrobiales bacterium]|nr:hypothetical protein [Verrucomicrobiales bacterium]
MHPLHRWTAALGILCPLVLGVSAASDDAQLDLAVSWGHRSASTRSFSVRLTGQDLRVQTSRLTDGESGDTLTEGSAQTRAGAGDVDGLACTLSFPVREIGPLTQVHSLWRYLWDHGNPDAARRLQSDPAYRPDSRRLVVSLDDAGLTGFTLTADQLLRQRTFWFPELDLFITAGNPPASFADHLATLRPRQGQRVLDRLRQEPEATYSLFTNRWEDMGSPAFNNPHSIPPGHIVGLSWEGALHKFGVDRTAGVRNDYGKADEFRLGFDYGAATSLGAARTRQHLVDGLPVIVSSFLKDGIECVVEQFVRPLENLAVDLPGEAPMALLQQVRLSNGQTDVRKVPFQLVLDRGRDATVVTLEGSSRTRRYGLVDQERRTLLIIEGKDLPPPILAAADVQAPTNAPGNRHRLDFEFSLPAGATAEFVVKLPSPAITEQDAKGQKSLADLDFRRSRAAVMANWNRRLDEGARFEVPEAAVNTLFRANLWHALRLPRRHGPPGSGGRVDLPYSNFAYDQTGIPWPVNQSVYVDYMLYDLRGHHEIAAEELAAMYRVNQEPNGHVGGFANWGVYTPGMLYSVGQHFLLSGDRASFDSLLTPSLRALDWCLGELRRTGDGESTVRGLVNAPLNDLSHDHLPWAFNQGYFYAGLSVFGRALDRIGHPRASECATAAAALHQSIQHAFAQAAARSPAVELADGTWIPYVPSHALASGRLFTLWYPTDVDTGSLHLPRLRALDPQGPLATYLLNDHEDNLLFRQWGAINEPVYNMQGTAYLLRDEPEAAIRTFYSTMACSFSHSAFEPVEHRWGWGQYFGPPSTDGSWFELYRNLLIRELDDDTLLLGQATPRAWLADGQRITVERAPTYFGKVDFRVDSAAERGRIKALVAFHDSQRPSILRVRLRHPAHSPMRAVTVNGKRWTDFDPAKEWVEIPRPRDARYDITASY